MDYYKLDKDKTLLSQGENSHDIQQYIKWPKSTFTSCNIKVVKV